MRARVLPPKYFLSLLGLFFLLSASAQYDCKEYEKYNCAPSTDKHYKKNGQSRSAMVQIGMPTDMNIIVYRGQDYRITVCADEDILGTCTYRLVELKRQLKQDRILGTDSIALEGETGQMAGTLKETRLGESSLDNSYETVRKVLYDNTEDNMSQTIEFSSTATKRIVLELIAPGSDSNKRTRQTNPNIACVGILVEHMPTPGLGF